MRGGPPALGKEEQRIEGLRAVADDYIVKPFSVHELEARLQAVLRRVSKGVPKGITRVGEAEVNPEGHEVRLGEVTHRLLLKEAELLRCFLQHPGVTLDRSEILREVWGYDTFPTTRTVDTHVRNLRMKIEAVPEQPVHRVGYRLVL